MDPIKALLIGVVAPGAVALVLVAALRQVWRGGREAALGAPWAVGVGLAAAYALAFSLILAWPDLPPVDVTQASAWLALVGAAIGALPLLGRAGMARLGIVGLLGVGVGLFLVDPLAGRALEGGAVALHVALVALTVLALDQGLARTLQGVDPRGGALALVGIVGAAAAAVLMSDVASLAQVTGGLAAGLGALFVLALWRPASFGAAAATPVVALVLASNLWSGVLYAGGRYEVVALVAAAPLALWACRGLLLARRRALVAMALPALVAVTPVAIAVGLAAQAYFADPAPVEAAPGTTGDAPADDSGYDPDYGY